MVKVEKVFFGHLLSAFTLKLGQPLQLEGQVCRQHFVNHVKVEELFTFGHFALGKVLIFKVAQVRESAIELGPVFSLHSLSSLLKQKVGRLLSHYGVVTLKGYIGRILVEDPRNSRPGRVTSPTEGLPYNKDSIIGVLCQHSFEPSSIVVQ